MKLRSIIKKLAICGASAIFLNYFSLPIACHIHSTSLKNHVKDKQIQKVCKTDSYLEEIIADDVLEVVRAAHAISAKYLTFEYNIIPSVIEKQRALKGYADCSYYSGFTYSNFLYLADKLGKPEFKDKVRLCTGETRGGGHTWLQVYFNNKWRNYETTFDRLKKQDKIYFKDIFYNIPLWKVLSFKDYYSFSYIQFENNELINYTKVLNSFKETDLKDLIIKYFSQSANSTAALA